MRLMYEKKSIAGSVFEYPEPDECVKIDARITSCHICEIMNPIWAESVSS